MDELMQLTVEVELKESGSPIGEVAICFDEEGLRILREKLQLLEEHHDHEHLMTPSWGGDSLTEKNGWKGLLLSASSSIGATLNYN